MFLISFFLPIVLCANQTSNITGGVDKTTVELESKEEEDRCITPKPEHCLTHVPLVFPLSYIPEYDAFNYALLWKCENSNEIKITINPPNEFGRLTEEDFKILISEEMRRKLEWGISLLNTTTSSHYRILHKHDVFDPLFSCRFKGDHYCTESHVLDLYDKTDCEHSWKHFYQIAITHDKYDRVFWRVFPNILEYRDLVEGVLGNRTTYILSKMLAKKIDFPQS